MKDLTRNDIASESSLMKSYWTQWNSLKLLGGCLYRVWESEDGRTIKDLFVALASKKKDILTEFHNGPSGGHLGITKTPEKLKQCFYWVGCQQELSDLIANCTQCMAVKEPTCRSRSQMQQYDNAPNQQKLSEPHEFVRNNIKMVSN